MLIGIKSFLKKHPHSCILAFTKKYIIEIITISYQKYKLQGLKLCGFWFLKNMYFESAPHEVGKFENKNVQNLRNIHEK